MLHTSLKVMALVTTLGLTTACAPPGAPYYHTQNGALMGATAGAVIGHQLDHRNGAVAGGLAGALIGGTIGNQMDYEQQGYASAPPPRRRPRYDYGPPPGYYDGW